MIRNLPGTFDCARLRTLISATLPVFLALTVLSTCPSEVNAGGLPLPPLPELPHPRVLGLPGPGDLPRPPGLPGLPGLPAPPVALPTPRLPGMGPPPPRPAPVARAPRLKPLPVNLRSRHDHGHGHAYGRDFDHKRGRGNHGHSHRGHRD